MELHRKGSLRVSFFFGAIENLTASASWWTVSVWSYKSIDASRSCDAERSHHRKTWQRPANLSAFKI